jgi:hypothetical protein
MSQPCACSAYLVACSAGVAGPAAACPGHQRAVSAVVRALPRADALAKASTPAVPLALARCCTELPAHVTGTGGGDVAAAGAAGAVSVAAAVCAAVRAGEAWVAGADALVDAVAGMGAGVGALKDGAGNAAKSWLAGT